MKKLLLGITIFLLLTGCNERTLPKEEIIEDNNSNKNFALSIIPSNHCHNQITKYYEYQDRTIYLVCLDEVYLKRNNEKAITLKYHLENVYQTFDDSINSLVSDIENIEYLKDGGTKIYKHKDYTIILCNTIKGDKDIYVGDIYMKYEQDYCIN